MIGILGGTGPLGQGLALRFAIAGERVLVGSRDEQRAAATVEELGGTVPEERLRGAANADVCRRANTVFVTVPYGGQTALLGGLAEHLAGKLLVSCGNALGFDEQGPFAKPLPGGSAAQEVQSVIPKARVVGAFHNVSASQLRRPPAPVAADVLLCGDDDGDLEQVARLVELIPGLRPVVAGPLRLSGVAEALTAILLSINRRYRTHAGVRITGLEDGAGQAFPVAS